MGFLKILSGLKKAFFKELVTILHIPTSNIIPLEHFSLFLIIPQEHAFLVISHNTIPLLLQGIMRSYIIPLNKKVL